MKYIKDDISYLLDDGIRIPKSHLKVCNIGKSDKTCRYLCLTMNGYVCSKNTPIKESIDKQVMLSFNGKGKFTAIGDNCEGLHLNEKKDK